MPSDKKDCHIDLNTAHLKLEPSNDSNYKGLKAMENDYGIMRYISEGIRRDPALETGLPNHHVPFSR